MAGLLDALADPEIMAIIAQRTYTVERIAMYFGLSLEHAKQTLQLFESFQDHEGQTLH
jgi:hypothetical protein